MRSTTRTIFALTTMFTAACSGDSGDTQGDGESPGAATTSSTAAAVTRVAPYNVALNKRATQSSTAFGGDPSRAVDGNTDGDYTHNSVSHTDNAGQSWWQVDLGDYFAVDQLVLWNRTECCTDRLSNFHVDVSMDGTTWTKLWSFPYRDLVRDGAGGPSVTVDVHQVTRYVRVQLNDANYLSLAEVQVLGVPATNLALGRPATQSSTYFAGFAGSASRAVDGNTDGNWPDQSVTHTNADANAWWQVDLGAAYDVGQINVFNRTDCCSDRLSNFHVDVSSDGVNFMRAATFKSAGTVTTVAVNRFARYVRVQLGGANNLSLAEVQVFAAPTTSSPLIAKHSGRCIDIAGGSLEGGAQAIQFDCHAGANQQMSLVAEGGGYYSLRAQHSGECLAIGTETLDSGGSVFQYECGDFDDQKFRPVDAGDGFYRFEFKHSGKCLEVAGAATGNLAQLDQADCSAADNQKFRFRRTATATTGDPTIHVVSASYGKATSVSASAADVDKSTLDVAAVCEDQLHCTFKLPEVTTYDIAWTCGADPLVHTAQGSGASAALYCANLTAYAPRIHLAATEDCAAPLGEPGGGVLLYTLAPHPKNTDLLLANFTITMRQDCGFVGHKAQHGVEDHPGEMEYFEETLVPDPTCTHGYKLHSVKTIAHSGDPANLHEIGEVVVDSCDQVPDIFQSLGKHAVYPSGADCRKRAIEGGLNTFIGDSCAEGGGLASFTLYDIGSKHDVANPAGISLMDVMTVTDGSRDMVWQIDHSAPQSIANGDRRVCGGLSTTATPFLGTALYEFQNTPIPLAGDLNFGGDGPTQKIASSIKSILAAIQALPSVRFFHDTPILHGDRDADCVDAPGEKLVAPIATYGGDWGVPDPVPSAKDDCPYGLQQQNYSVLGMTAKATYDFFSGATPEWPSGEFCYKPCDSDRTRLGPICYTSVFKPWDWTTTGVGSPL